MKVPLILVACISLLCFSHSAAAQSQCSPNPCENGGVCSPGTDSSYSCACPLDFTGTNCTDTIPQRLIHVTFDSGAVRDRMGSVNLTLNEEGAGSYLTAPWASELAPLQGPRYYVRPARVALTTGNTTVRTPYAYSLDGPGPAFVATNPVLRWGSGRNFTIAFYRLQGNGTGYDTMQSGYFYFALNPGSGNSPSAFIRKEGSTSTSPVFVTGVPSHVFALSPGPQQWVLIAISLAYTSGSTCRARRFSYTPSTDSVGLQVDQLQTCPSLTAEFPDGVGVAIGGRPSFNDTFSPFRIATPASSRGNMNPLFEMAEFQVFEQELSLTQIAQVGREFLKAPRNACNLACANNGTCVWAEETMQCVCANGFMGPTCTVPCPTGFNGVNCTNNINDCCPMPCFNGGTCHDGIASYTCQCPPFYSGTRCENYDYCNALTPCQNGGACSPLSPP
jgi:hypothetical protein